MQTKNQLNQYQSYRISNVRIWGQKELVHLEIADGSLFRIHQESPFAGVDDVIDAKKNVLIPAGVDPQVHLRVPGQPQKELPLTGLQAALYGGVGALLTMPNTKPVIDSVEVCEQAMRELQDAIAETGVSVFLSAAISKNQKGQEPVNFYKLARWGVRAFTDDGVGVVSDEIMKAAFEASAATGRPILQHAEFPGHGGILAKSRAQEKLHIKAYPEEAESDMVARDLKLLKDYPGARYHVLHVSSAKTIKLIERAKDEGLNATCEVSPHHLFFCGDDINTDDTSFKMNPPLRTSIDRQALREALRTGVCDFVATDHAPHEPDAKGEDFKTSAYGTTGLETLLKTLLTLWKQKEISTERLVEVFSSTPAKFLGIDDRFGKIELNFPFNAVLIDEKHTAKINAKSDLKSLSKNNCFVGSELTGNVKGVFLEKKVYLL